MRTNKEKDQNKRTSAKQNNQRGRERERERVKIQTLFSVIVFVSSIGELFPSSTEFFCFRSTSSGPNDRKVPLKGKKVDESTLSNGKGPKTFELLSFLPPHLCFVLLFLFFFPFYFFILLFFYFFAHSFLQITFKELIFLLLFLVILVLQVLRCV